MKIKLSPPRWSKFFNIIDSAKAEKDGYLEFNISFLTSSMLESFKRNRLIVVRKDIFRLSYYVVRFLKKINIYFDGQPLTEEEKLKIKLVSYKFKF